MADVKNVVMLILPTRGALIDVHDRINQLGYASVKRAAVIAKAADGEVQILDDDIKVDEGSITGGTLGAMISAVGVAGLGAFLLPGVGAILAIGAASLIGGLVGGATGGTLAGLIDNGFNDQQLRDLSTRLDAGEVAVVYEVDGDTATLSRLRSDLASFNAEVIMPNDAPVSTTSTASSGPFISNTASGANTGTTVGTLGGDISGTGAVTGTGVIGGTLSDSDMVGGSRTLDNDVANTGLSGDRSIDSDITDDDNYSGTSRPSATDPLR